MLRLDGVIRGKKYEDQLVSGKELVEIFDVKLPNKEHIELRIHPARDIKDRFGQKRMFSSFMIEDNFSRRYNGSSVRITMYDRNTGSLKEPNYIMDNRLFYTPPVVTLHREDDLELLVYLYLHPACEDSPLRTPNESKAWYIVFRPELVASQKMISLNQMSEAINLVQNADSFELRTRAAGLRFGRAKRVVSGLSLMTDEEVRAALAALYSRRSWNIYRGMEG